MMRSYDSKLFDPLIFAASFKAEIDRGFQDSLLPVNLLTSITYEPFTDGRPVITDGHMIHEHPIILGFTDFAPFYLRLRVYLSHWVENIEAEIREVRIASDQFDEVITSRLGMLRWMHNGGPPLMN